MANILPNTCANFETSLATAISSSASSLTAASITTDDGVVLPTKVYGITVDQGTNQQEHMIVSFSGTTAGTIVTRGVSVIDGTTNIPALQFAHARGASIKFTDHPVLIRILRVLQGTDTLDSKIKYTTDLTFIDDKELISKKYADDLAIAGAPDASTTVKGIVEAATSAELAAGTATGATGALLAATGASFNATSSAAVLVPVTNSSGKLAAGFGGAASSLATLNGSSKVVEDPANAQTTSGVGKIPLGKAITGKIDESFQQTTDANILTLTNSSTSDASLLHTHNSFESKIGVRATAAVPLYETYLTPLSLSSLFTASNNTLTVLAYGVSSVPTGDVGNSQILSNLVLFQNSPANFADLVAGKKLIIEFIGRMGGFTADQTGSFGLTGSAPTFALAADSLLFGFSAGNLYATSGNTTAGLVTQSTALDLSGVTLTNKNIFRIEYTPGTDAKFYINGVLKATITTNLPNGANNVGFGWYSDGNTNTCYFRNLASLSIALQR